MDQPINNVAPPRWLHRWAVLTVCAALPLLLLGAEVTTKGVGMVDARGLRTPWHFFAEFLQDHGLGWLIEHGHRQAGWIVGMCVIVLAIGLWRRDPRPGMRFLGLAALAAIILQGVLGIFRIELNALLGRSLALIHGCFAQLVFTLLVSLAVLTSRSWISFQNEEFETPALRRWSLLTCCIVFGQLVLGSLVRHRDFAFGARAHLLTAFLVVAAVVWLATFFFEAPGPKPMAAALCIGILLVLQLWLGMEAWLSKFYMTGSAWTQIEPLPLHAEFFRSLHYVTGAGLFASITAVALYANRSRLFATTPVPDLVLPVSGRLEGVA